MKPFPSTLAALALFVLYSGLSACQPDDTPDIAEKPPAIPDAPIIPPGENNTEPPVDSPGNGDAVENENPQEDQTMNRRITIRVGYVTFSATLETNETASAFARMLPMTVNMTELNRNEKYCNLPESLPTQTFHPGSIHAGDLLLWGNNTVVLFYKTFTSSYSYTKIGKIDQPYGLEEAVGTGNITVTFELLETNQ